MPFAFLIVGAVFVVSGVRDTSSQLLTLLKGDLQGNNSYLYWIVAILLIGSVGYIPDFKGLSRTFLALVLVVLILKEGSTTNTGGGFFQEFTSALKTISTPTGSSSTSSTASVIPALPTLASTASLDSGI